MPTTKAVRWVLAALVLASALWGLGGCEGLGDGLGQLLPSEPDCGPTGLRKC